MTRSRFPAGPVAAAFLLAATAFSLPARAQTPIGAPPPPPGPVAAPAAVETAPPPVSNAPALPVPDSVVAQLKAHAEGDFGSMERARSIGMIQSAWDEAPEQAAVFSYDLDPGSTYKVRVREYMVTVIELPAGELIEAVDLGDAKGFEVKPRGQRRLAVRAAGFGFDSNIIVYGKSGTVYPIYLRAEGYNSRTVPDLLVRIQGSVLAGADSDPAVPGFEPLEGGPEPLLPLVPPPVVAEAAAAVDGAAAPAPAPTDDAGKTGDFVKTAPFDPGALRGWGDYSLWGSDDSLKPQTVYRDDHFTYIKFGDRWKDIELPTAYVVVDQIDELVNTRVSGDTFIIESTRPLITLKSGSSYLCIRYDRAEAGA